MVKQMQVRGKMRNVHLMTEYTDGSWSAKINVGKQTVYGYVKTNARGESRFYVTSKGDVANVL